MQTEIQAHEKAIQRLRSDLDEARGLLVGAGPRETAVTSVQAGGIRLSGHAPTVRIKRTRPIREGSSVGWAMKILREAGHDIDAQVLTNLVNERGKLEVTKATLVSSLARYVRERDTFTRPKPGYYGLKEFEGQEAKGDLLESA